MEKGEPVERPPKAWSLKRKLILIGLPLLIIVALAVGLGVGLTQRHKSNQSDDGDSSEDTTPEGNDNSTSPDTGRKSRRDSPWAPKAGISWQIILQDPITLDVAKKPDPDVAVYDLDLWENDAAIFQALQQGGKKVICYFSAGSYEDFRPDKGDYLDSDLGKPLDGWPGERWVDTNSDNVRDILRSRIKMAADKGCDAIDPDNVDGYQNDNGLALTSDDSISLMRFLANEAGKFNMSTGLKNAGDIIPSVLDFIAFSVNEQCVQYSECETFAPFVDTGKPVFNIEYPDGAPDKVTDEKREEICSRKGKSEGADQFSTVIKTMDLDGWVEYCDGSIFDTPSG